MAGFGLLLRHWREARGYSQQYLAAEAGMSTRHLSFLETERSGPSEPAVTSLARTLALSDRETQRLLYAAGFASDWTKPASKVTQAQLSKVATLLAAQDPYPAFITDPAWQIISHNRGGQAFFARCLELNPELSCDPMDIAQIVVDPHSMGKIVTNTEAVQASAMAGLFQLVPDPASAGNTEHLYQQIAVAEPSVASPPDDDQVEASETSGAWEIAADFEDQGVCFTLELLAIPFGGPCAGYGLLLTNPVDEEHAVRASAYFSRLINRLPPPGVPLPGPGLDISSLSTL